LYSSWGEKGGIICQVCGEIVRITWQHRIKEKVVYLIKKRKEKKKKKKKNKVQNQK